METNSYSDELLVKRFLDGESRCFDELISKYQVLVFSLAVNLLGDETQAAEAVAEIFVDLSRRIKHDYCTSFETLVHRTAYDLVLSKMMFGFGSKGSAGNHSFSAKSHQPSETEPAKCWFSFGDATPQTVDRDTMSDMDAIGYTASLATNSADDPKAVLS